MVLDALANLWVIPLSGVLVAIVAMFLFGLWKGLKGR